MSFFPLIFLSFLTNQTEENKTLKTTFEIFKNLRAYLVSVFEYCFLFLRKLFQNIKNNLWKF